jgi:glycosyltransferase involved in cell wall biosynthesis
MRSLCIISRGYPHRQNPISFPFVRQFAHAAARQGVKVTVIAPLPFHVAWRGHEPEHAVEEVAGGHAVDVFYPRYLSTSSRQVAGWNTARLGFELFCRAVRRVLRKRMQSKPDALYGHFLYMGGAAAVRMGVELGIPAFPMVGEGLLNTMDAFGKERALRDFSRATAFMANSSCLAGLLQQDLGVRPDEIGVFPNGIDHRAFYPRDKAAMRAKYGLPLDALLVICVAFQDVQKGPVRVGEAIRGLAGVKGVFLGKGPNPPQSENVIINRSVPHGEVPEWLSAADVFVLPSTFEGCCNAALEAMSCGLPVVSSNGTFNDDILTPDVAFRVDPLDVPAIRAAIVRLRDEPGLRTRMGEAALRWSDNFDADRRARRMLDYMRAKSAGAGPRSQA